MARTFGATHLINSAKTDLHEEVCKVVGSSGVDVFIENTGVVRLIEKAYELTAKTGRTILVGVPRHDQDVTIHSLPLHFGKVLTGCEGGHTNPATDIPRYLRLHRSGKLDLAGVITHRFPFERINEALDAVRSGEAGRCLIQMV
jgi:S-(hydroxymethyl)glutathione dehydrogenase/alcohol dehydrogenase